MPSHAASTALCSGASLSAVNTGVPSARRFIFDSHAWYIPSGPMMFVGDPTTMPSKSCGYRCASSKPSRPPVEQPLKYECTGGLP